MIYNCNLRDVGSQIARLEKPHVISLLDPGQEADGLRGETCLRLRFEDIRSPKEGVDPPSRNHIECLLAFGGMLVSDDPIVVHCQFGMGRSPAAAFILACLAAEASRSTQTQFCIDARRRQCPTN